MWIICLLVCFYMLQYFPLWGLSLLQYWVVCCDFSDASSSPNSEVCEPGCSVNFSILITCHRKGYIVCSVSFGLKVCLGTSLWPSHSFGVCQRACLYCYVQVLICGASLGSEPVSGLLFKWESVSIHPNERLSAPWV